MTSFGDVSLCIPVIYYYNTNTNTNNNLFGGMPLYAQFRESALASAIAETLAVCVCHPLDTAKVRVYNNISICIYVYNDYMYICIYVYMYIYVYIIYMPPAGYRQGTYAISYITSIIFDIKHHTSTVILQSHQVPFIWNLTYVPRRLPCV
jgi:hypothetical protein